MMEGIFVKPTFWLVKTDPPPEDIFKQSFPVFTISYYEHQIRINMDHIPMAKEILHLLEASLQPSGAKFVFNAIFLSL